ncbi:hypothetical protein MBIO_0558 [Mycoplasmopsis fermentans PG18]|uniref:Uncharacterized protein n=3 Tax=Mycoplasmopsis fermentans TaxID=2115 RepID=C4XFA1_MYCFP|nr:hypothetical protein [Mycoplasmopsis fermentans]VEU67266.1 Uncharacterised protein [Mesomycoplasma conjunctivae]AAN85261.1 ICEF-II ORF11 [Mycoplasmopsis fermentans]AAN85265.1 ICEF-II ORF11 [Mycoplasmopsis fermentans]ADV34453.1 Conserved Hypothetical Protein [Mycoplasmopsis fermentans M64]ADV34794.1 Conserved Hypothetical Protein [Mycoplasmopsis fermentans M64]
MIEKVFCFKDLYYLTQYALSDISDEEVVAKFNYLAKNIKNNTMRDKYKKQVLSIVDKMSNVDDDINQKIFDKLFYVEDTNEKNLEQYITLLNICNVEDLENIENNSLDLKFSFNDFFGENGYIESEYLFDLVDEDLKQNGINSKYIYSLGDLSRIDTEYVYIDDYLNFHPEDIDDIKKEYIENLASLKLDEIIDLNNKESIDANNKVEITDKTVKEAQKHVAGIVEKESETAKVKNTK